MVRRSRQVLASQNRCEVLFFLNRESHAFQICPTPKPACSFLTVPCSKLYDPPRWWKRISSRFSWLKVWTGVKCNFTSAQHQDRNAIGKLWISRARMCNITTIRWKTKMLCLSIIPAWRRSHQPSLGQPPKGVNYNFSLPHFDESHVVGKLSIRWAKYTISGR